VNSRPKWVMWVAMYGAVIGLFGVLFVASSVLGRFPAPYSDVVFVLLAVAVSAASFVHGVRRRRQALSVSPSTLQVAIVTSSRAELRRDMFTAIGFLMLGVTRALHAIGPGTASVSLPIDVSELLSLLVLVCLCVGLWYGLQVRDKA
jgi:hypothetical protein